MSINSTDGIYNFISENTLETSELLSGLKQAELVPETCTVEDLIRVSRSLRIGLASNGNWYTDESNGEVADAVANDTITDLASEYLHSLYGN